MRERLVARGQKFVDLIESHHQHYDAHAFFQRKDGIVRVPVNPGLWSTQNNFERAIRAIRDCSHKSQVSPLTYPLGLRLQQSRQTRNE